MELHDRTAAEAVAQIATLLAHAYERYRRTRRIGRTPPLAHPHWRAEDAHYEPRDRLLEFLWKDAVPVVEDASIRMVAGPSLLELLHGRLRRRMGGHIVLESAAASHIHQHEGNINRVNPGTEITEHWCTENETDRTHMVGK